MTEQHQIVTIRGTGGMGKTTLVNALAQRLRFYFYQGVYAISLFVPGEQTPLTAASVCRRLANLLGIHHPAFDQGDAEAQELVLSETLRTPQRLLLIWDNYETVLWRLADQSDPPEPASPTAPADQAAQELRSVQERRLAVLRKQQAYHGPDTKPEITLEIEELSTLLNQNPLPADQSSEAAAIQRLVGLLAAKGVHLLFTTRQSPVKLPGETLYPSVEQGHQLGGLASGDSVRLLRERVGQRIPSSAFLEQLAAAVGHSPLAL